MGDKITNFFVPSQTFFAPPPQNAHSTHCASQLALPKSPKVIRIGDHLLRPMPRLLLFLFLTPLAVLLHLLQPPLFVLRVFDITRYPPVVLGNCCIVACSATDAVVVGSFSDCGEWYSVVEGIGGRIIQRWARRRGDAASSARV